MSFGDHLEELRRRVILSLLGIAVAVVVCVFFAPTIIGFLCRPILLALNEGGYPPTLYQDEVSQLFVAYLQVAALAGVIIASPWVFYQVWLFVSAGLYEHERRFVRVYGPVSLGLFLLGAVFAYFVVMPFAMRFFVVFNNQFSLPGDVRPAGPIERLVYSDEERRPTTTAPAPSPLELPVLDEDPPPPAGGRSTIWMDHRTHQVRCYVDGEVRTLARASPSMVTPIFAIGEYMKFTIVLMFVFGIGFQTPLVIMFVARIGLLSTQAMASKRRVVILLVFILAAILTPPDVISQIALAIPMWGLFELGLVLGRHAEKKRRAVQPQ
ncbi:MAG: Sec-independent protein translocase protein TatC [Phycisphaerae bacterium]|nr:Sec-independent protein translocase protein TatC [Phycisphaerae bacterium]